MPLAIDLEFLKREEGNEYSGYLVEDNEGKIIGKSGVTIGVGVDLGQQSEQGLKELGISPDTVRKLKPYLGLKGEKARKALERIPLNFEGAEGKSIVDTISATVINDNTEKLITKFNKKSTVPFTDLSPQQQTVVYSITHQYGREGAPSFLAKAQAGNWEGVREELRDFGDPKNVPRLGRTDEYMAPRIPADRQKVIVQNGGANEPVYQNG
jgi:GH24 family phage-related lysozyme (muramidase)